MEALDFWGFFCPKFPGRVSLCIYRKWPNDQHAREEDVQWLSPPKSSGDQPGLVDASLAGRDM